MKCPLNKVAKVLSVALLTAVAVAFTSCGGKKTTEKSLSENSQEKMPTEKSVSKNSKEKMPKESKKAKLVTINKPEDFNIKLSEDGTYIEIVGVKEQPDAPCRVEIPSEIEGFPVKNVNFYEAPKDFKKLIIDIKIPEGVTEVYLANLTSLKSIELPSTLEIIPSWGFAKCFELETIKIPDSVKKLDSGAFQGCKNLKNVIFPNKVNFTEIPMDCFSELFEIDNVFDPNSKKEWFYLENLHSIIIPEGITEIGTEAFYSCPNLETVTLPSTIKKIKDRAFSGCNNLKTINIPDNITKLSFDDSTTIFNATNLPLATQKKLRDLGYKGKFNE